MKSSFIKRFSVLFLFLISLTYTYAQDYGQAIALPSKPLPKEVSESVVDMGSWLQQATGKKFGVIENEEQKVDGIQLQWIDQSNLPTSVKNQIKTDGQSFYLELNGNKSARIVGSGTRSFINGIYTFLHELGFRWYMPGDTWAIIPSALPRELHISKVYKPDFQSRFYAGTGGVNAIGGTDPKNSFKQDYNLWNRRNRFSTDYAVKGHMGQAFYNANKNVLGDHPEWFCNGKVNRFGRIDISHPDVVQLFTDWALSQVEAGNEFPAIGVDPADGAGGKDDCLPEMPGIKTWSDKYFWLANQVANRLDQKDDKTQVQLYAYSKHAAPPSIELEKNVYPIIIPYAFQRISSPAEFIRLWSNKMNGRPMGIYDYWNITQWSIGVPQFNIYSIPEKLRLWKQYNITSINLETTNGKGAMGPALWLASQMMWDTKLSFDSLYNDFLNNCFGRAAADVKTMYDRWSRNYQQEMEVNLSLRDLAAASAKTKDKAILDRLNELKAYVHYLKLFYDYKANPKSAEAFEQLVSYIHSIHHLRLVQSSALLERYIKPPVGLKKISSGKQLSLTSVNQIELQFEHNIKENAATYFIPSFTFDVNRAKPLLKEPVATAKHLNGRIGYQFFLAEPRMFRIQAGANKDTRLTITGSNQKIWFEKNILGTKEGYSEIQVQLPAGVYNLSFGDFARFSRLIFPADLVFISSGVSYYDNAGYPKQFVYVPKEARDIIYEDKLGPGANKRGYWLNPDGKKVEPVQLKNSIYRVEVPPQYRGKVWTLDIGHRSFKLLNIPNRFSLRKFEYNEN